MDKPEITAIDPSSTGIKVTFGNRSQKEFVWHPVEDITTYELARCMPLLIVNADYSIYGEDLRGLPDNCKRHFRELGDDDERP
jgi:hypothetical protein